MKTCPRCGTVPQAGSDACARCGTSLPRFGPVTIGVFIGSAALLIVACVAVLTWALTGRGDPHLPAPAASGTSPLPAATSPVISTVETRVDVVRCPSSYGIEATGDIPSTVRITAAAGSEDQLSMYADEHGWAMVLAPEGWSCEAMFGANGTGGLSVFPRGESSPWEGRGQAQAVNLFYGGPSGANEMACGLFREARKALRQAFGTDCPQIVPPEEEITDEGSELVAFVDPPGIEGTGDPSGGPFGSRGIVRYEGSFVGATKLTCTLEDGLAAACDTIVEQWRSTLG